VHDSHYPVQLFREFNRTARRRSRCSLSRDKCVTIVTRGPRRMILIMHRISIIHIQSRNSHEMRILCKNMLYRCMMTVGAIFALSRGIPSERSFQQKHAIISSTIIALRYRERQRVACDADTMLPNRNGNDFDLFREHESRLRKLRAVRNISCEKRSRFLGERCVHGISCV